VGLLRNGFWLDDNGDQNVGVVCLDAQDNFADASFSVTATMGSPANSSYYTYAFADNPAPTTSYVPERDYQIGFRRGECTIQTDSR
jgi:hypothetical protein